MWNCGSFFRAGMSAGLKPVVSTSMLPAFQAFNAVAASVMIGKVIVLSLMLAAPRNLVFLTRVSEASCFQDASLNGPSVTMLLASVHLLPNLSTAPLLAGRNELC